LKTTSHRDYLLVGVTGGIGSGKSTVCKLFSEFGRHVISADEVANDLTGSNPIVMDGIRKAFGDTIYLTNGSLDRKRLASIVFSNPTAKKKLDSLVHPAVFSAIDDLIKELSSAQRIPYVIVEAALIYESGMDKRLDHVIVVDADEAERISRVMNRDGCSREEVLDRIHAQMDVAVKLKKADFVISNSAEMEELRHVVRLLDAVLGMIASQELPRV
jgi:dephospho-CoA kinase